MTAKKPAERRQNRATKDVGNLVPLPSARVVHAADDSWRDETKLRWSEFWGSPLANQVEISDVGALRRLFWLYDELDRLRQSIEETGRMVIGSQGQPRPNPLYKEIEALQAESRHLEDRFGLSPLARLRLGITLMDARASLDSLNARLQDDDPWSDTGFDDASEA